MSQVETSPRSTVLNFDSFKDARESEDEDAVDNSEMIAAFRKVFMTGLVMKFVNEYVLGASKWSIDDIKNLEKKWDNELDKLDKKIKDSLASVNLKKAMNQVTLVALKAFDTSKLQDEITKRMNDEIDTAALTADLLLTDEEHELLLSGDISDGDSESESDEESQDLDGILDDSERARLERGEEDSSVDESFLGSQHDPHEPIDEETSAVGYIDPNAEENPTGQQADKDFVDPSDVNATPKEVVVEVDQFNSSNENFQDALDVSNENFQDAIDLENKAVDRPEIALSGIHMIGLMPSSAGADEDALLSRDESENDHHEDHVAPDPQTTQTEENVMTDTRFIKSLKPVYDVSERYADMYFAAVQNVTKLIVQLTPEEKLRAFDTFTAVLVAGGTLSSFTEVLGKESVNGGNALPAAKALLEQSTGGELVQTAGEALAESIPGVGFCLAILGLTLSTFSLGLALKNKAQAKIAANRNNQLQAIIYHRKGNYHVGQAGGNAVIALFSIINQFTPAISNILTLPVRYGIKNKERQAQKEEKRAQAKDKARKNQHKYQIKKKIDTLAKLEEFATEQWLEDESASGNETKKELEVFVSGLFGAVKYPLVHFRHPVKGCIKSGNDLREFRCITLDLAGDEIKLGTPFESRREYFSKELEQVKSVAIQNSFGKYLSFGKKSTSVVGAPIVEWVEKLGETEVFTVVREALKRRVYCSESDEMVPMLAFKAANSSYFVSGEVRRNGLDLSLVFKKKGVKDDVSWYVDPFELSPGNAVPAATATTSTPSNTGKIEHWKLNLSHKKPQGYMVNGWWRLKNAVPRWQNSNKTPDSYRPVFKKKVNPRSTSPSTFYIIPVDTDMPSDYDGNIFSLLKRNSDGGAKTRVIIRSRKEGAYLLTSPSPTAVDAGDDYAWFKKVRKPGKNQIFEAEVESVGEFLMVCSFRASNKLYLSLRSDCIIFREHYDEWYITEKKISTPKEKGCLTGLKNQFRYKIQEMRN